MTVSQEAGVVVAGSARSVRLSVQSMTAILPMLHLSDPSGCMDIPTKFCLPIACRMRAATRVLQDPRELSIDSGLPGLDSSVRGELFCSIKEP
jgi:hypothetical protein